jgi:hypothetical protein
MNITNITKVLDEVGNISDAIRLAEEDAGEANRNITITMASLQKKVSI